MTSNREREAYEYATRVCGRLPRCLQECREAAKVSRYGLQKNSGVSRDMLGDIEDGESVPTLFLTARMAYGMGLTLTKFVAKLEGDEDKKTLRQGEGETWRPSDRETMKPGEGQTRLPIS